MPVTDAQVQAVILSKVGDIDPTTLAPVATQSPPTSGTGLLATNLANVWAWYLDKAAIGPRVQALYVERDLLIMKMTALGMVVNVTAGGVTFHQDHKSDLLAKRYDQLEKEIAEALLYAQSALRAGGAIGQITQVAPVQPPIPAPSTPWQPPSPYADPNAPWLAGSPYWPGLLGSRWYP